MINRELIYASDPVLEGCEAIGQNEQGVLPQCVSIGRAYSRATRPNILGPMRRSGAVECENGCHVVEITDTNLSASGAIVRVYRKPSG